MIKNVTASMNFESCPVSDCYNFHYNLQEKSLHFLIIFPSVCCILEPVNKET